MSWEGSESELSSYVAENCLQILKAYAVRPQLSEEHYRIEQAVAQGGYGHRQIYELVQNGADALIESTSGRIEVVLTDHALYCANEGDPIDRTGIEALLGSYMSRKRGPEIGRFGLGFKSVLAVTTRPEFFSQPVSFVFDPTAAAAQISAVAPSVRMTPCLRIAQPLDPVKEADADPVLADLMDWATTVVRLVRDRPDTSWLPADMGMFPTEFLLFASQVTNLVLDTRSTGIRREIKIQRGGESIRLLEGDRDEDWSIFESRLKPSKEARADAGELADRIELPIAWAVPVRASAAVGRFWAFVPTSYETTLSGIVNAPWKTNPDRENLLPGPFNELLLDTAAKLVVDNLSRVTTPDDPGKHLDLMPARGREARNWADRRMTEEVYRLAAVSPSLPDQRGVLRRPTELRIHPARTPTSALELWTSFSFRPSDWVHSCAEQRDRRSRIDRLLESAGAETAFARYDEWLQALAAVGGARSSSAALAVSKHLADELAPLDFADVRLAKMVLSSSGALVAPNPDYLFIGGTPTSRVATSAVARALLADSFTEATLREIFKIRDVDVSAELRAVAASDHDPDDVGYWTEVWMLAKEVEPAVAAEILRRDGDARRVRVMTVSGHFAALADVLLPGPIVQIGTEDGHVAIDEAYHKGHLDVLRLLGATATPTPEGGEEDAWLNEYRTFAQAQLKAVGAGRAMTGLEADHHDVPTHVGVLADLSPDSAARLTTELLRFPNVASKWTWRAAGHRGETVELPSPAAWRLRDRGRLFTTKGPKPVRETVGRALDDFGRLLPVARAAAELTSILAVPNSLADIAQVELTQGLNELNNEVDDELIGRYLGSVVPFLGPPGLIRCRQGTRHDLRAPSEVTVVSDSDLFGHLRNIDIPVVLAATASDASRLIEGWGLRSEGALLTREIAYKPAAPSVPLVDEFPNLRLIAAMGEYRELVLVRCSQLTQILRTAAGQVTEDIDHALDSGQLYWLQERGDESLLRFVSDRLHLALDSEQLQGLLQNRIDEANRQFVELVRSSTNETDRVLTCLGADVLRRYVPNALFDAVLQEGRVLDDRTVAEMALAVNGIDILREASADLEHRGLRAPSQWAGSRAAQTFVRDLGFPREYAGFAQPRLESTVEVDGPIELLPLHDFQVKVKGAFLDLLDASANRHKRAMLSLPTGAGKTRVAVQSIIEYIEGTRPSATALWVAQTDELCEQAVQSFSEVWRSIGPKQRLSISRLWEANEADPVLDGPHVVVATIQKLSLSVVGKPGYEWLREADVVIIDEAHLSSEARTYTSLLDWLGLGGGSRGTDRCPLVGLTATPFKKGEVASKALVNRYGGKRLDDGVFPQEDPYPLLQERGILAKVRHELLEGVAISLSTDELKQLNVFQRLPRSVEARIGADASRNRVLVNSIKNHPEDWPVLVFAASVEHAQTLAALLRLDGVTAAAISAETQTGARRHYIEEFRSGRTRVLTNYGVLTTGFDAPEIRAVYLARPTYSPNLYQQMIGRGLRGPANGGKAECLIVDVQDNVTMYEGKLAFTTFEYLWKGSDAGAG